MSDPDNIVLVGGGGHCKSVIDAAESAGYRILGILDMPEYVGSSVLGYPVVGTDEDLVKYVDKALFLVTVGHIKDASLRIRLHEHILSVGGCLATVVASTAVFPVMRPLAKEVWCYTMQWLMQTSISGRVA